MATSNERADGGIGRIFSTFSNKKWDVQSVLKTAEITPTVQTHLKNVFGALVVGLLATAVGVKMQWRLNLPFWLPLIGMFGCMFALLATHGNTVKRLGIFLGFAFLKGMSLGDFVAVINEIDSAILPSALLYTTAAFVCFGGFAAFTKRRSQLYLGAILSSVLSWLALGSLLNIFFRSTFIMDVQLYGGLLMFLGYVVFDVQVAIERAHNAGASADALADALQLYVDFIAIAVRIAIILAKSSEKKEKKSSSSR